MRGVERDGDEKKERNQKKKVFISWQPEVSFLPFQHVQGEESSSTKPNSSQPPVLRQGNLTKQQKCWYVKALKAEVWFSQRYDMLFFVRGSALQVSWVSLTCCFILGTLE